MHDTAVTVLLISSLSMLDSQGSDDESSDDDDLGPPSDDDDIAKPSLVPAAPAKPLPPTPQVLIIPIHHIRTVSDVVMV